MIVRCAFCPTFVREGEPETVLAAQQKHRATKHPERTTSRRKKHRRGSIQVSDKTVAENIAGVREQGGATWVTPVA